MLDAPVFLRGKMVGVVCHEHTGRARRWKLHEELLASTFADFVALVLETAAWHEAEDALRVERDALESKVAERTRELQESEANLRALVDFSPVAMVLTRIADSNGAAGQPAGGGDVRGAAGRDQGRDAPQHWVDLAERGRYLEHVMRHGRVDDFEAEMRSRAGGRSGRACRGSACASPATTRCWRRSSTSPCSGRRARTCSSRRPTIR